MTNGGREETSFSKRVAEEADGGSLLLDGKLAVHGEGAEAEYGRVKTKNVLIESSWEAAKARERSGREQRREPKEVTNRRRLKNWVQECYYGFARVTYDQILEYVRMETSELCLEWEIRAQS